MLLKTYIDIQHHDKASSYVGMSIKRSSDLTEIYISQRGLSQRIIDDILPDDHPKAASPASSNLFNSVPDDKPFDHIKYLSIIMAIMNLARLSRPDVLLATAYLATKAQYPTEVIIDPHRIVPNILKSNHQSWNQNQAYRTEIPLTF